MGLEANSKVGSFEEMAESMEKNVEETTENKTDSESVE